MSEKLKFKQIINDINDIVSYMNATKQELNQVISSCNKNFSVDDYGYYNYELDNIVYELSDMVSYLKRYVLPYCKEKINE